ncbi:putative glycolipid-binding domain-containing protein [Actinomadura miaoliensis]|uniref:Glycolipid-binding domain-containing protein n=1 Tax=Actinomadura miaoliensis TaxID=430685 RepID=A0ABP7X492_9ACTN
MTESIVWVKPGGAELAEVRLSRGELTAAGTAIGGDPLPYRLEYELTTDDRLVTTRLMVEAHGTDPATGPWKRGLELLNRPEGEWHIVARAEGHVPLPPPGGDASALKGALDCDLGLSPLTNTMPVLRPPADGARLLDGGGPAEFLVAWVSVPDLAVSPSRQTYTFVRRDGERSVVRFDSDGFTADIVFDRTGLVVDYPFIGRRVVPETAGAAGAPLGAP